jgi:hypothetical protein
LPIAHASQATDAALRQASLRIGDQGGSDTGPSRLRRHIQLVKFLVFDDAKSSSFAERPATRVSASAARTLSAKPLNRAQADEFCWRDLPMTVMPAIMPDPCKVLDLRFGCSSDFHDDQLPVLIYVKAGERSFCLTSSDRR